MQNHNSRRNIFFLFKHHAIDVSRSSKKFKFYNFNLCCINHPSIHLANQAKALDALWHSTDDTGADIENVML
jgi:hypothetical protein